MGYVRSMISRLRGVATAGIVMALLYATTGCAAEPPDAWVLAPISYDNRMDGDTGPSEFIDASYPMSLVSDTAGGFWGVSAGSWLHIDEDGTAVSRFNVDPGVPDGAIDAVTPTVLAIATGEGTPSYPGTILLFDTEAMSWEELYRDERALGDIATTSGAVYYVAYTLVEPTFTIEKMALTRSAEPVTVSPALDVHGPVAIDIDNDGILYIATPTEHIILGADGTIRSSEQVSSTRPGVSVNDRGDVAWSGEAATAAELPIFVSGGSEDARRIIDCYSECDPDNPPISTQGVDHLTLSSGEESVTLPFLCSASGFTWINDVELVVSVGDEGGAPLIRVTPPDDSGLVSQSIR